MQMVIASDHAGFPLKQHFIKMESIEWIDCGPDSDDSVDYPDFADTLCKKVIETGLPGVLICGSGQGMAMRANKYQKIRAALCWTTEIAQLSRQHNNANVLCLGSRTIDENTAQEILKTFISTNFEGGRHQKRIDKLNSTT